MTRLMLVLLLLLPLAACSTGIPLHKYAPQGQPKDDFTFCSGYSCTRKVESGFTDKDWASVRSIFVKKPAKDAEGERSKIAAAIARMESLIGAKTGTAHDLPEARGRKEDPAQMDCLDETVNTSRYLEFLEGDGLLKLHRTGLPVHRGYMIDGAWPHNTATIIELETAQQFVVDSFYRGNGQPPYIMPAKDWLAGWKPKGSKQ